MWMEMKEFLLSEINQSRASMNSLTQRNEMDNDKDNSLGLTTKLRLSLQTGEEVIGRYKKDNIEPTVLYGRNFYNICYKDKQSVVPGVVFCN